MYYRLRNNLIITFRLQKNGKASMNYKKNLLKVTIGVFLLFFRRMLFALMEILASFRW